MVVERTTKNKAARFGGRGTRSTSKKGKQQEDSSETSGEDTTAEATMAERTQRTLQGAELKATETFLQAQTYLDSNQVTAVIHHYWCKHKARARPHNSCTDHRRNSYREGSFERQENFYNARE